MAYIKLRDYQQEALKSVQEAWKEGINHQLIVLPTGAGKTIIMAAYCQVKIIWQPLVNWSPSCTRPNNLRNFFWVTATNLNYLKMI